MFRVFTSFSKVWFLFVSSLLLISATEISAGRLKRGIGFFSTRSPVTYHQSNIPTGPDETGGSSAKWPPVTGEFSTVARSEQATAHTLMYSNMSEVEMEKMRNKTGNDTELDEFGFPKIPGGRNSGTIYSTIQPLPTDDEEGTYEPGTEIIDADLSSILEMSSKGPTTATTSKMTGTKPHVLLYLVASMGIIALLVIIISLLQVRNRRVKKATLTQI